MLDGRNTEVVTLESGRHRGGADLFRPDQEARRSRKITANDVNA